MEIQRIYNGQNILEKDNYKTQYKAIVIKTVSHWQKIKKSMNATEYRNKPHIYGKLIFDKGTKIINGKIKFFQQIVQQQLHKSMD